MRCLKTGNKIPLGYGFCECSTKTYQLVRCIKEWLLNIIKCGLKPIATVCDQNATNIAAINALVSESNSIRTKRNIRTSRYNYYLLENNTYIFINNHIKK